LQESQFAGSLHTQSTSTISEEQTLTSERKYARSFCFSTAVSRTFHPGKEKKRVDRSLAQSREALAAANELSEAELREALKLIKSEPQPPTQEGKENYFMSQVAMGEQLATKGMFLTAVSYGI
jgi:import receptor subunit TOM20